MIEIDKIMQEWAAQNPFFTDALLFNFLRENEGSCSFAPLIEDGTEKSDILGNIARRYSFAVQVMLRLSDSTDTTNTDNMYTQRRWQEWIWEQEADKNYPDFGPGYDDYHLEVISNGPELAQAYENGYAKYQFFARLTYTDHTKAAM